MTFHEAEKWIGLDVDHGEIGAFLLDLWNLPALMVEAALFHHNPAEAGGQFRDVIETLAHSDRLVDLLEMQKDVEAVDLTRFEQDFLSVEELAGVVAEIQADIRETVSMKP